MGLMEMVLGIWSVSLKSKIIALDYGEKRENQIPRTQSQGTMSQAGEGNAGADSSFDKKPKEWIYLFGSSQA